LYLLDDKKMTVDQVSSLLYKESGLKGVSGITNDIRQLLQSDNEKAQLAVDMFCLIAARNLASLIPTINGLDTIIFTAGIGENSSVVREKICQNLNWLGIELDAENNNKNNKFISHKDSKVNVCVIPTNEEFMIARHTKELLES
jgi:acetate kinase